MDTTPFLSGLAGFFLGMLVWSRVLRWVYSIVTVSREQQRDPANRSKWRLVPVTLLNSGLWMLVAFTGLAIYILPVAHAPGWDGFFWGAFAAFIFMAINMVLVLRRFRKRQAERIAESPKTP